MSSVQEYDQAFDDMLQEIASTKEYLLERISVEGQKQKIYAAWAATTTYETSLRKAKAMDGANVEYEQMMVALRMLLDD